MGNVYPPVSFLEVIMGELLFKKWLEECVVDLRIVLVSIGVEGLLHEFELWLDQNGYLNHEN